MSEVHFPKWEFPVPNFSQELGILVSQFPTFLSWDTTLQCWEHGCFPGHVLRTRFFLAQSRTKDPDFFEGAFCKGSPFTKSVFVVMVVNTVVKYFQPVVVVVHGRSPNGAWGATDGRGRAQSS